MNRAEAVARAVADFQASGETSALWEHPPSGRWLPVRVTARPPKPPWVQRVVVEGPDLYTMSVTITVTIPLADLLKLEATALCRTWFEPEVARQHPDIVAAAKALQDAIDAHQPPPVDSHG